MMTTALQHDGAMPGFLAAFPEPLDVTARTLANAWSGGGGRLAVGSIATRLIAGDPSFTAGTIVAPKGDAPGHLEFSRVILERHGVGSDAWVHWSDEFADLAHHGFDQGAKYPRIPITNELSPAELVRLVQGLRDLATMVA